LQVNMSLDAINPSNAKKIAGVEHYNIEHVKNMIEYAASKLKVIVAPVMMASFNEKDMEEIIKWVKTLNVAPILGIQNYLQYKTGRSAGDQLSWDEFYQKLNEWEQKYDIKLRLDKNDFNIRDIEELSKPFKVGDTISATVKCPDRFSNSVIAVALGRSISVPGVTYRKDTQINVKIMRDKHNIFTGKVVV